MIENIIDTGTGIFHYFKFGYLFNRVLGLFT
jgi:hypothetical protein